MPFTICEAAEWAEVICNLEHEYEGRSLDYEDLCEILDAFLECIGRDAESAGWFEKWEGILEDAHDGCGHARTAAPPTAGELHLKAVNSWIQAKRKIGYDVSDGAAMTVGELRDYIFEQAENAAGAAQFSIMLDGWPATVDGKVESYAKFTGEQIDQLSAKLDGTGMELAVVQDGATAPALVRKKLRISW